MADERLLVTLLTSALSPQGSLFMSIIKVVHLNSQMGVADAVPSHHSISALGRLRSGAQYERLDGACWVTLLLTVLGPRGSLRQLPKSSISLHWISYLKSSPVRVAGPRKMGHPLANRSESTGEACVNYQSCALQKSS